MDFTAILKQVAPTLATALLGPLGGAAVAFLGDKLGLPEKTIESVGKAIQGMSPEELSNLKKLDQEFSLKMKELDINLEAVYAADRDSARKMQVANKSWTPEVLSWIVVISTLALEGYLLVQGVPPGVNELVIGRVLGTLDMAFATVLAFWLGVASKARARMKQSAS